jgi:hypothetical protein
MDGLAFLPLLSLCLSFVLFILFDDDDDDDDDDGGTRAGFLWHGSFLFLRFLFFSDGR